MTSGNNNSGAGGESLKTNLKMNKKSSGCTVVSNKRYLLIILFSSLFIYLLF